MLLVLVTLFEALSTSNTYIAARVRERIARLRPTLAFR